MIGSETGSVAYRDEYIATSEKDTFYCSPASHEAISELIEMCK